MKIDGKAVQTWADQDLANPGFASAGTTRAFTMRDGGVRRVQWIDFF